VRQKEDGYPVEELLHGGWLDLHQFYQGKPCFDNLDVIVSFYGRTGTRACFCGKLRALRRPPEIDRPAGGAEEGMWPFSFARRFLSSLPRSSTSNVIQLNHNRMPLLRELRGRALVRLSHA
jgi:hypothetical protein